MRAVNLVPLEERRGAGAPTRSGGVVYAVLGALAVAVVMMAAWTITAAGVEDRRGELQRITAQADAAERAANALAPYRRFADLRERRVTTVKQLAAGRFDWAATLHEVGRVVPREVRLTSIVGTVAPGVALEGASSGSTGAVRSALSVPALEIVGCTRTQSEVARFLARLRTIQGVTRVSLAQSAKGGSGGAAGGDCRDGEVNRPQFEVVAFFERSTATSSTGSTTG